MRIATLLLIYHRNYLKDYPILPSLLKKLDKEFGIIKEEAQSYTWICYVKLR
jgi:hypothetical protein